MSQQAAYTRYHPRWHRTRVSTWWWLGRWSYFLFILRELTSLAVLWFVVWLILLVRASIGGRPAYQQFLEWAGSPILLALNVLCFALVCLHVVTWFNLAPAAMVVNVGGRRVPDAIIVGGNYAAWAAASALIAWVLLRS